MAHESSRVRFRDIKLPIGRPWFALLHMGAGWRILWPVHWQGWLAFVALYCWLSGSAVLFFELEWQPDNSLFCFWFLPTVVVSLLVVGVKTDLRAANGL